MELSDPVRAVEVMLMLAERPVCECGCGCGQPSMAMLSQGQSVMCMGCVLECRDLR